MKTSLLTSLLIVVCSITTISCSNDSDELTDSSSQLVTDYTYSNDEMQLLDTINNYRDASGLNPLVLINHISYKS